MTKFWVLFWSAAAFFAFGALVCVVWLGRACLAVRGWWRERRAPLVVPVRGLRRPKKF